VVSHGLEWRRDVLKDVLPVVVDKRGFAVHETRSTVYLTAIHRAEALMSEANPEHGNPACEMFYRISRDTVIFDGFAGPWGNDKVRRIKCDQIIKRDLIIAEDAYLRAELTEVLDEIIGEGVIVIY
jgi:hypothetical protein